MIGTPRLRIRDAPPPRHARSQRQTSGAGRGRPPHAAHGHGVARVAIGNSGVRRCGEVPRHSSMADSPQGLRGAPETEVSVSCFDHHDAFVECGDGGRRRSLRPSVTKR